MPLEACATATRDYYESVVLLEFKNIAKAEEERNPAETQVQAEAEATSSQQADHAGPETSEMSSLKPSMQVQAEEEEVAVAFERAWLAASGQGVDM